MNQKPTTKIFKVHIQKVKPGQTDGLINPTPMGLSGTIRVCNSLKYPDEVTVFFDDISNDALDDYVQKLVNWGLWAKRNGHSIDIEIPIIKDKP